jgi:pSer/pThr/pTyr-binding forkhead associated (FHA) protein
MPYLKTLDQRHRIRLSGPTITVGSDPTSNIPIRAPFVVAAQQFTLMESGGRYVIQNTDPAGRTHVNGHPVDEVWLNDGDVIHAGDLALLFSASPDETGETAPIQQRPSTPFQPKLPTAVANAAAAAEPPAEEFDYEQTVTSHLRAEDLLDVTPYEQRAKQRSKETPMTFWLTVASIMFCCAVYWNRDVIMHQIPILREYSSLSQNVALHQPRPLTAELAEHLSAVQMVATLPPTSFASLALSDLLTKTSHSIAKERVNKQVVGALSPLITDSSSIERLTLINGSLPTSRFVVLTLKDRPTLDQLVINVPPGSWEKVQLHHLNAIRLKTRDGNPRHVLEVRPGNFIVTDVSASKIQSHLDLHARIGGATGIVAMTRVWPAGFISSLNPVSLAKQGLDQTLDSYTVAPLLSLDFSLSPKADVIVPTTDELSTRSLVNWKNKKAEVAAGLIGIGTVTHAELAATNSTLELHCELSTGNLLDEIWRRHFNDLDLKFRPLGMD